MNAIFTKQKICLPIKQTGIQFLSIRNLKNFFIFIHPLFDLIKVLNLKQK